MGVGAGHVVVVTAGTTEQFLRRPFLLTLILPATELAYIFYDLLIAVLYTNCTFCEIVELTLLSW